jgi:hypothetical protein
VAATELSVVPSSATKLIRTTLVGAAPEILTLPKPQSSPSKYVAAKPRPEHAGLGCGNLFTTQPPAAAGSPAAPAGAVACWRVKTRVAASTSRTAVRRSRGDLAITGVLL